MRTAVAALIALAALLLACGGDSAPLAPQKEAVQPGAIIYFRQSPAPLALVAVNADGSDEHQLFSIERAHPNRSLKARGRHSELVKNQSGDWC